MSLYFYAAPLDDTLDATVCRGVKEGTPLANYSEHAGWTPTLIKPSAIHGRVFNCAYNGGLAFANIHWQGRNNFPIVGDDFSIVLRFQAQFDGVHNDPIPTLFSIQGPSIYPKMYAMALHHWNDGYFRMTSFSNLGSGVENTAMTTTPVFFTRDQSYDLVLKVKVMPGYLLFSTYVDGVAIGVDQPFYNNEWRNRPEGIIGLISLGIGGLYLRHSAFHFEEFAIYQGLVDHSPFNGAARTTPIATASDHGITWPAENKVDATAPTWKQFGVTKAGSLNVPGESIDPIDTNVLVDVAYKINGANKLGKLKPGVSYTTLRGFLNYILDFINASSLTDDEYALVSSLDNPDFEWNVETYTVLAGVLDARGAGSGDSLRLKYVFLAQGVTLTEYVDSSFDILLGGEVDSSVTDPDNKSNILIGGVIED